MNGTPVDRGRAPRRWLPPWLRTYRSGLALQDAMAGLVVTVLLVPQSLAYAMLAGLPPHVGMYASLLPLLVYAVLGSSMTLAVGPVAVASLMTATAIAPLAPAGSPEYLSLAILLALLGGAQLLLLGILKFGFVANLLSHPVISGFITGTALLIATGQLRPLLGIDAEGENAFELIGAIASQASLMQPATAGVGVASAAVLWMFRHSLARLLGRVGMPTEAAALMARLAPMVVVVLGIVAVHIWDLDTRHGVAVVGPIPPGLPALGLAMPSFGQMTALLVPAFTIALVGFVESISIAQSLAMKRGERIDPNAELRGLGAANLVSALSGGFPVTGGFARSVVNFTAGARTPMAGVISAVAMAVVLAGLTGPFERLPLAVLAATIIVAVLGLVDFAPLRHAWQYDRADALAWLGTAIGVLAQGVETGILLGVSLSVGTYLWRASRPHMAVLGRVSGTEHFRNEQRFRVGTEPGLLILRIDENLFFGNISAVIDRVQAELGQRSDTSMLLLVLSSVSHIDTTAAEALLRLQDDLRARAVDLRIAEIKGPVLDRLNRSGWARRLAHEPFLSVHQAVQSLDRTRVGDDRT